jgi:DNA (cytosine-5)-methyltransferase 1
MKRAPILRLFEDELIVDNFAGGGGASTGIEDALGRSPDIAINHDAQALSMHKANHPTTKHYQENVWDVDPIEACAGRRVGLAWFSPDCKHFSKAKGGKPVDKKIRALAWIVIRWAKAFKVGNRPRVIVLENVEEFQDWGPLLANGKPDPTKKGLTFRIWKGKLEALGYEVEFRELRASDYDTPTIRKRLFLVARCDGEEIRWPEKFTSAPRTAAQCIDWDIHCPSIFDRKKPLAQNTLRRIANGIKRFVLENPDPFIVGIDNKSNGGRDVWPISDPLRTVTVENRFAVVTPYIIPTTHQGDGRTYDIREPMRTITGANRGEQSLISPTLIQIGYGERKGQKPRVPGLHKPLGTVVAGGQKHALVAAFLAKHFGGNETPGWPLRKPISTVTAQDHHALVTSNLIKLYGTCKDGQDVRKPMPTVTGGGTHIGEVRAFLTQFYGDGGGQIAGLDEPMRTIRTKDCLALVMVRGEQYAIVDIGMRMLTPRELFRAQGFPEDYQIAEGHDGKAMTKTDQVRMCGNSVCPPVAAALLTANFTEAA